MASVTVFALARKGSAICSVARPPCVLNDARAPASNRAILRPFPQFELPNLAAGGARHVGHDFEVFRPVRAGHAGPRDRLTGGAAR